MRGRRATRGILSTMAKGPHAKKKPVRRTLLQSIGFWLGAALISAVGVVIVAAFVTQIVRPPVSVHGREADVPILELTAPPPGSPVTIVAGALVEIERRRVTIPLTEAQRDGLRAGTQLHVKYTSVPSMDSVRVDGWERRP